MLAEYAADPSSKWVAKDVAVSTVLSCPANNIHKNHIENAECTHPLFSIFLSIHTHEYSRFTSFWEFPFEPKVRVKEFRK